MQTAKDYTRKLLLETARSAFFRKGFKAVSMREISKKSGVGLSNIYNYYPSKDDLLAEVLYPLLEAMDRMLVEHNHSGSFSIEIFTSEDYQRDAMHKILTVVSRFRAELQLLFFSSQDSRFQNYWEEWISRSTKIGMEYMEKMKILYPQLHTAVSPFFMHFICSWWVNMMKEVLEQKELSEAEIECFIGEYIRFCTGGWKKIMQVEERRQIWK